VTVHTATQALEHPVVPIETDQLCFYCGGLLLNSPPLVLWFGSDGMWLHASCALRLASSLLVDAMAALEVKNGLKP